MEELKIFSVRIVSIDYYMAPPMPGIDISTTSLSGGNVKEVPVIRIFGSTPAGQKTCLHVHGALPYFYIPLSDLGDISCDKVDSQVNAVSLGLNKGLKLKGDAGLKRQHVHCCSLVQAKKFYGYHHTEELFLKIYLYYPQDVSRAANLLLGGTIMDKIFQPYESHVPFLLQFMIDYNLYGMGHVHVSKIKFRHPVPDVFSQRKSMCDNELNPLPGDSSIVQDSQILQHSCEHDPSVNGDMPVFKRQSTSEFEADAVVDDIINQQFISYARLSQTHSEAKMVQSLIPIWEEFERTGMPDAVPPDSNKPLPQDVLRILSVGIDSGKFKQAANDEESGLPFTRALVSGSADDNTLVDLSPPYAKANEITELLYSLDSSTRVVYDTPDQLQISGTIEKSSGKTPDEDALRLLKWLASSQAAEDINSDDELFPETILSPLIPVKTIGEVLEKANVDYESESQQECQDILDSILHFDENERAFNTATHDDSRKILSSEIIPQVDGSSDDLQSAPHSSKALESNANVNDRPVETQLRSKLVLTSIQNQGRKRHQWGSLPISHLKASDAAVSIQSHLSGRHKEEIEDFGITGQVIEGEKYLCVEELNEDPYNTEQANSIIECSTRELMRRKRSRRIGSIDSRSVGGDWKVETYSNADNKKGDINVDAIIKVVDRDKDSLRLQIHTTPGTSERSGCPENDKDCGKLCIKTSDVKSIECSKSPNLPLYSNDSTLPEDMPHCGTQELADRLEDGNNYDLKNMTNSENYDTGFHIRCCSLKLSCSLKSDDPGNAFIAQDETDCKDCMGMTSKSSLEQSNNSLYHERNPGFSRVYCSSSDYASKDFRSENPIAMVFSKRPPTIEWVDALGSEIQTFFRNEEGKEAASVQGIAEDCLPFFSCKFLEENSFQRPQKYDYIDRRDSNMGVPIIYQNDGSYLFMLTPVLSPPSRKFVDRWLSYEHSDTVGQKSDARLVFPFMSCESSGDTTDSLGSQNDVINADTLVPATLSDLKAKLDRLHHHHQESYNIEHSQQEAEKRQLDGYIQDSSQISGPDRKMKPTPLSQIGFRDPASVGGGQQLTLLSIEVQAESRGDLRPDPRFDAINVLVLVYQDDDESTVNVHVLLRCDLSSGKKDLYAISEYKVLAFTEELHLISHFTKLLHFIDPDIIMGWDVQSGSLGFLAERAGHLGIGLLKDISRTPSETVVSSRETDASIKNMVNQMFSEPIVDKAHHLETTIIEDEWGRTHASGVHVGGRIVLNVWRLMRNEVKLNSYTIESVAETVLRRKIPYIHWKVLNRWFSSGPGRARYRSIEYAIERTKLNLQIMNQLDVINRTSELARVFGIEFFSVLSRGSQYRVESMLLRLAHTQNYLAISPGNQQVANQPAMECLPLVMEPESGFYEDPVIVLDFQSLYPSMVISYNLCFCTCLGKITPSKENCLGVSSYSPDMNILDRLKHELLVTPNGVLYVPSEVRKGILPRLLEEILSTRIMVKQAMKKLTPSQLVLKRIYNARQLALKLIANVIYGYTAAGFSGRMPCAELADSIVQCGRRTLEAAISFVNSNDRWKARVIYGDTDSMFVLLKGRSLKEAFTIGQEIASAITEMNPYPVTLKMEKIYYPCFLLTKKRYVGYSYETHNQSNPTFDAKGIETVRRDTCGAVSKTMEQSLRIYFECRNIDKVQAYLQRQWTRILSGRISLQDFVFAKEVRLGTYSARASSIPPAAIVATKAMRVDPRAEPRYAERIPYVVVHGEPGARLVDMVVDPLEVLAIDSPFRLNDVYYIRKQIIPTLQRVFGLVGADLCRWFLDMPRPLREAVGKRHSLFSNPQRKRIEYYYTSKHCVVCGVLVQASTHICHNCVKNETTVAAVLTGRTSKLEKDIQHLVAICRHCGGGDWLIESGVKCTSLACSVFYERRKVQKELLALSEVSTRTGFYPKCMVEWF